MNKKVLMLGYYGANNIGDEIMLYFLLKKIRNDNICLKLISENPEKTLRQFHVACIKNMPLFFEWGGLKLLFNKNYYILIWELIKTDVLFIGGGDLIRDDKGWKTFCYTMSKIVIALMFKADIYIINVGIGVPITKYGKFIIRVVLNMATMVIVRDNRSYNICKFYLKNKLSYRKIIDVSVNIKNETNVNGFKNEILNSHDKYIVISLRENSNAFDGYKITESRMSNFANELDRLIETYKIKVIFLPFQHSEREQDKRLHDKILRLILNKDSAFSLEWTSDFFNIAHAIKGSFALIGMRLHSIILASSYNIPCIAMPYDAKIIEYCLDVGIDNFLYQDSLDNKYFLSTLLSDLFNNSTQYRVDSSGWDCVKFP